MSIRSDDPILEAFAKGLEKAVPCYKQRRKNKKNYGLKKCDSTVPLEMRQFGAVGNRSTKGYFRITVKNTLVDDWCRSQGVVENNVFGRDPGLVLQVKHSSTPDSSDYRIVVRVLRIAKSHPKLTPCP
jgi:hypothetical protein